MKYARTIAVALFAAAMILGTMNPATAVDSRGSTFLVGDSTSWRLTGQYDDRVDWFAKHGLDWHIDAVGGRSVSALPQRIFWYLSNVDSAPKTFIMALGTNPASGWTKEHYEVSLSLLPPSTNVVLVTPVVVGSRWTKSGPTRQYSKWLAEIVAERPRTALVNWRGRVMRSHPDPRSGRSSLLREGIHQTPVKGRRVWLDMVRGKVDRFNG